MLMFLILFWGSIFIILFAYLGFPAILLFRARHSGRKAGESSAVEKSKFQSGGNEKLVSVLIAAHNEESCIVEKLTNLFSLDFDPNRLEVIVASDGSTDRTNELVSAFGNRQVKLLALPRQGKNATLNAAVAISRGEILIFTDADTLMNRNSLKQLLEPFEDPSVGAVGGDYRYLARSANTNEEKTYWNYDRILKRLQSAAGSMTSATGQIYAIRRQLFHPIPEKLIDDFYVSVQAPSAHYRLLFAPDAVAYGTAAEAGKPEFDRKVRVVTGGLRTVWKVRHLLNPLEYGFYAFQLFTHKVLRRLLAIPLLMITISSAALWQLGWFYQLAAGAQLLFHTCAAVGCIFRSHPIGRIKFFSLPFFFDLVNLACLVAFFNLLTGARYDVWKPARASAPEKPQELCA